MNDQAISLAREWRRLGRVATAVALLTSPALFVLPHFTYGAELLVINFLILFGPLVVLGIQQTKAYDPGDADWGVKLEDVRGQAEAKSMSCWS